MARQHHPKRPARRFGKSLLAALLSAPLLAATPLRAADEDDEALGFERTPPRLSLVDGESSFFRPGGEDWALAQINTALAAGDQLYTAEQANLEIQIGARAYVRAGERTQLGLSALEPDYLQLRVTDGDVSLDLRALKAGQTLEVDTPNAAFTVERTGYYRVTVDGETSTFISRRGGRAIVTPASGVSAAIAASEQVVVTGVETPSVETYAAPELDSWDRWNYARTDRQIDAVSARYVPSSVYGLADLDQHGDWRQVPSYGAVWVPRRVAVDWAPYSTGRWMYDSFYGWTWVDAAPWGWAPFHYGRWVHVSGFWGWCPGPIVVRPYYAPALVAFYGGFGVSVGVSVGLPHFGWVALGWGEPLVPWWGPAHFRRYPRWAGWGGPRYVNRVVVKHKTVINVDQINVYENARVRNGVVVVERDDFGRHRVDSRRMRRVDTNSLQPVRGELPVRPSRASLVPDDAPGRRPPREARERRVVTTREPRPERVPAVDGEVRGARAERDAGSVPPPRVVQPTRDARRQPAPNRPPFGTRGEGERNAPPPPPRYEDMRRSERRALERPRDSGRTAAPPVERSAPAAGDATVRERRREAPPPPVERSAPAAGDATVRERRREAPPPVERSAPAAGDATARERRREAPPVAGVPRERSGPVAPSRPQTTGRVRELPGEPANRVYRQRQRYEPAPQRARDQGGGSGAVTRRGGAPQSQAPAVRSMPRSGGGGQPGGMRGGGDVRRGAGQQSR